ncbi:MAG TPA: hypothetical protein VGK91_01370 [Candidatus Udaeobacter sp.]
MLLFRIVFVLILSILGWVVHLIFATAWNNLLYFAAAGFLLSFLLTWVAGSASRGVALRKVRVTGPIGENIADPQADLRNSRKWYIESLSPEKGLPYSCSFVEFDERGDYLDFLQHKHAYQKVIALAQKYEHLIVVIFLHGWRNNGQSGNVIDFNEFLHQLATNTDREHAQHRVHGIYLSWRGACLRHAIRPETEPFGQVTERYGGEIVDLRQAARFPGLNGLLETFSYFDRKGVPEHLSSGTALSRTIMTCARVAKRFLPRSHVFLIGHSFGGLMLERTFQNATVGELIMAWPFRADETGAEAQANPLPFDTVLLVNSAAPSIYARQFQSLLAAHGHAMSRYHVTGANSPVFFSLTSSGDWATGITHPLANRLCFLLPTLRRKYRGDDFILATKQGSGEVLIQQSYYYRHTPGHNPLLVNRFIEHSKPAASAGTPVTNHLRNNLLHAGETLDFTTSPRGKHEPSRHWRINFPPQTETFKKFSCYKTGGRTYRPVAWEESKSGVYLYKDTPYWIIRCPKEIIKDHNDIWSQQAMDAYAALYAIALTLREDKPPVQG